MARARPVNSEGRHDRSDNDVRKAADSVGARHRQPARPPGRPHGEADGVIRRPATPDGPRHSRAAVPPDDALTSVLPAVRDNIQPHLRDPIEAVKAALDGTPPPKPPPRPPGGGGRPGGPPGPWPQFRQQINSTWVRGLLAAAAVLVLLPLVTFGMAYLIVDVPKPGDIRTNQVSTILASDGSELAKIVPPEGNRVDVNIDQIPVHVRDAVMAAEDRDF